MRCRTSSGASRHARCSGPASSPPPQAGSSHIAAPSRPLPFRSEATQRPITQTRHSTLIQRRHYKFSVFLHGPSFFSSTAYTAGTPDEALFKASLAHYTIHPDRPTQQYNHKSSRTIKLDRPFERYLLSTIKSPPASVVCEHKESSTATQSLQKHHHLQLALDTAHLTLHLLGCGGISRLHSRTMDAIKTNQSSNLSSSRRRFCHFQQHHQGVDTSTSPATFRSESRGASITKPFLGAPCHPA